MNSGEAVSATDGQIIIVHLNVKDNFHGRIFDLNSKVICCASGERHAKILVGIASILPVSTQHEIEAHCDILCTTQILVRNQF